MLCPSRLNDAQGPITWTRHNSLSDPVNPFSAAASSVLAAGSSDTVTVVSDVEI